MFTPSPSSTRGKPAVVKTWSGSVAQPCRPSVGAEVQGHDLGGRVVDGPEQGHARAAPLEPVEGR
jgi:hypothetical protein